MFTTVELGSKLARREYEDLVPRLRQDLLELQQELRGADFPVIVLFGGVDGAGKGETVNELNAWMDPRWIHTHSYPEPSDEERERPEFWRYWRDLPPKGQIGIFLRSWYRRPVLEYVHQTRTLAEYEEDLDRIVVFERKLALDGALILKFWMHLSKSAQKKRLKKLEKDPLSSWQVTETDWQHWHLYDEFIAAAERGYTKTSTGRAPWHLVEGVDHRYRSVAVGSIIRDAIRRHLDHRQLRHELLEKEQQALEGEDSNHPAPTMALGGSETRTVLSMLAPDLTLSKSKYKAALKKAQGELNRTFRDAKSLGISSILVLEGMDAGGKGGAIRRITGALNAVDYDVHPIAAPSDEELAQHYLWRFWRRIGRAGRLTIFDRSWYGRVLVERVEGFASEAEWMRAYAEINDFEEQLACYGIVVLKFWLHITEDEQLARFQDREKTPFKRWKLTDEDWRNREKWEQYEYAVHDMVERTGTRIAPWILVEGNDKRYARIKVLNTYREHLSAAVKRVKKGDKACK
jgi:polyphosphate:AMP phosphotransferase